MAASVEKCIDIMKQVRRKPLEAHDPLTQDIMRRAGGDVERRSLGENVSDALQAEIDVFALLPLSEGPGEGIHRDHTHEKTRASASTSQHLKQDVRRQQEQNRIQTFRNAYGERGRQVMRYEWRNFKRIAQTEWRHRWEPRKLTNDTLYKHIYHEDLSAETD